MGQNFYDDRRFFEEYRRRRNDPDTINNLVEQPALRACLPPLERFDILELGCGMGHLSLHLAKSGARRVLATDVSQRMLAVAKSDRPHGRIEYRLCAMEDIESPPASFDLVVGSLSVHYVADHAAFVKKVARWLRPGGRFVYSVEHPIKTAPRDPDKDWIRDADGNELSWPVSGYGEEGPREQNWIAGSVVKHHIKLSTMLNDLISAGMTVERVEEPEEVLDSSQTRPVFPHNSQRPTVLILRAAKDT